MMLKFMNFFSLGLLTLSVSGVLLANDPKPKIVQHTKDETSLDVHSHAQGQAVFNQCAACHLASGDGVKGAFPPLRNRLAKLSSDPAGRLYLKSVLLQGLNGHIKVGNVNYNGYMQSYGSILSDQQISSVLNYVSLKLADQVNPDFNAFSADEIAATRLLLKDDARSSRELRKDAIE
ncbi:MAG: cytochrome c [Arenicella sp.]|nr:cytochrome c [Arenicella sp.]